MKKIFTPTTQFLDYLTGISIRPKSQRRSKKFLYSIFVLLFMGYYSMAQVDTNSQWTWVSGDNIANQIGIYGDQGITSQGTKPGARVRSVSWRDTHGNLWLMGGYGYATGDVQGFLNDLWKYNIENNQWTWVAGDNTINQYGIYGIQGIASPNNKPGARNGAASWTDPDGNFWLMGGNGYYSNGFGFLNDLWKYNPTTNEWTWIKGDNASYVPGVYGTQGVPAASNKPGGREHTVTWTDSKGKLWLMGGAGYDTQGWGYLNDLWKYDPVTNEWTWIKGENISYSFGVYGTQGITASNNKPGARQFALGWTDQNGKFWMMGGVGNAISGFGSLNDLWKYDPETNEWTWMKGDNTIDELGVYGTIGVTAVTNKPGARYGSCNWIDPDGKLWLLGGYVGYSLKGIGYFNDLWKYDPETNEWTWVKGDKTADPPGVYGTRGIAANDNNPKGRQLGLSWIDLNGKLCLMGGYSYISNGQSKLNDLWKYDPVSNQWTWMKGDNIVDMPGEYGTQGISLSGNKPGGREHANSWIDSANNLWLIGGLGFAASGNQGWLNDLWKYNPSTNEWTWMNGDNITNQPGVYGMQGISADGNKPGGRLKSITWKDLYGKFWLMGGQGHAENGFGSLNDLWKYDPLTNEWTWIKGDSLFNQPGVYGIKGISDIENKPGGRWGSVSWSGDDGSLWLMGGYGFETNAFGDYFNDLWRFNPSTNEWTWVKGDNTANQPGIYGTQGISGENNKPGGRHGSVSWKDNDGKFWLMGGLGYSASNQGYLNDLWKYDPLTNVWTWVKGDKTTLRPGVYGIKGTPSKENIPGARQGAESWVDLDGKLWLMGGEGIASNGQGLLNDLWKYDPITNNWTWINGDSTVNQLGIYGTLGTYAASNKPGGRYGLIGWIENNGNTWVMSGYGISSNEIGWLNDLWKLTPTENTYFKDADSDGYGNPAVSMRANYIPTGYVIKADDCNDNNSAIHPNATEICDGIDNNCNGQIDEGCSPVIAINDIIVREGDNGYRNAVFTLWLNSKPINPVSVHYQTIEGSATAPEDYMSKSGTITFAPNCLVQTVTVKVRGDRMKEQKERFRLFLTDPVNGILRNNYATCTIIDDDKDPVIHIHDAQATENSQVAKVKVTLSDESRQVVKVQYDTKDKTARSPADFTGICNNQLIFMPGETEKFIHVVIKKDNINEKTEEFLVILKDAVNATLDKGHENRNVAEVKIINSEPSGYDCYGAAGSFSEKTDQPLSLQLKVLPNPSANYFQLNINSNGKGVIRLRVTDMLGRVVEDRKTTGMTQQIKLGDNWRYGNYILELTQGDERKTIQLVKLR